LFGKTDRAESEVGKIELKIAAQPTGKGKFQTQSMEIWENFSMVKNRRGGKNLSWFQVRRGQVITRRIIQDNINVRKTGFGRIIMSVKITSNGEGKGVGFFNLAWIVK